MKQLLTLSLMFCFLFSFAQTQLGNDIDGEAIDDESGVAISLSLNGQRIAIGSAKNDGNGNSSGHVRILEISGGSWNQIGSDIDGEAQGDASGVSVSLSADGKRVAIGANKNDGIGNDSGHIRVYEENGGVWTQVGNDIDAIAVGAQFGWAVSISADGKRVAAGAPAHDGNGTNDGLVSVFQENGGSWTQVGSAILGKASGDNSGFAVSLSSNGKRVAIGAILGNGGGFFGTGQVRVFEENGGVWTQVGGDLNGENTNDSYGNAVSLSADGKRVAIGAWLNSGGGGDAGHVRVFEEIGGVWTQIGTDIDGNPGEHAGFSTYLSSDGKKVIIGAPVNSATDQGRARVYEEISGVWSQVGNDIVGEAPGDRCGRAVAFSPDANVMAVGANYNDGNGSNSGHVRVYGVCCNAAAYLIEPKVILEGPYDPATSLMKDDLRASNFIPLTEPYTMLGYNHLGGGGETTTSAVLSTSGPNAIVDWVYVELREASDNSTPIATRSALLQADGDIVDLDGTTGIDFTSTGISTGNYWIVIRHRTHLDVMSAFPVFINGFAPANYDFSVQGAFNGALKLLNNGDAAMYEGDVNQDGVINALDRSLVWNERNQTGYLEEDSNLNGICAADDRSQSWNNRNQLSQVP